MKRAWCYQPFLLGCSVVLASGCSTPRLVESFSIVQKLSLAEQSEVASPRLRNSFEPGIKVAEFARTLVGVKYRYGGTSPQTGMDCSGFIIYVFRETLGIDLPRAVPDISRIGQPIELADLQPGDLVFYNTRGYKYSHAGIYLGNNTFIHSPSSGKSIHIVDMEQKYWRQRFNGARRLIVASMK